MLHHRRRRGADGLPVHPRLYCGYHFAGIHFSFTGYFAACGKSYIGFLHNIIAIVLVRVPGAYLASRLFAGTLLPMGLAAPAGSLLSVMICVAAYRWMKRRGTLYTAA